MLYENVFYGMDIEERGDPDWEWIERMNNFLTLAHQAASIAAEANPVSQRYFLRTAQRYLYWPDIDDCSN